MNVNPDQPTVIDEIKNDVDSRYLSASECLCHLFGFPMQDFYPTVQKLQSHLHDNHQILYTEGEEAAAWIGLLKQPSPAILTLFVAIKMIFYLIQKLKRIPVLHN